MTDELTTCRRCGRKVPKTIYCIYCGTPLLGLPQKVGAKPVEQKKPPLLISTEKLEVPEDPFDKISKSIKTKLETLAVSVDDLDAETRRQLGHLRKYTLWKIRLCGFLVNEGISGEVFTRIYNEYVDEIRRFSKARNEKINHFHETIDTKRRDLNDSKWRYEELHVRATVGELNKQDTLSETARLTQRINTLSDEIHVLQERLSKFENLFEGTSGKELYELEETIRMTLGVLEDMADEEKISHETAIRVREGLLLDLKMFEDEFENLKNAKEIHAELDVLEARLKVGEIDNSFYSSEKNRLLEILDTL